MQKNGSQVTVEWWDLDNTCRENTIEKTQNQVTFNRVTGYENHIEYINRTRILGVVPKIMINQKENFPSLLKLIRLDRTIRSEKPKSNEARLIKEIKIDELEIEIIKFQGFSKGFKIF